jgi:hypothetical protein
MGSHLSRSREGFQPGREVLISQVIPPLAVLWPKSDRIKSLTKSPVGGKRAELLGDYDMRALPVAAAMVVGLTVSAAAQMVGPGMMGPGMGFPGAGGSNFNTAPAAPPPGEPPCFREFAPLRGEAQKRAEVLKAAMQKKVAREEACKLLKYFSAAEAKVVSFITTKAKACGIPPEAVTNMKANHERTAKMENQVCNAAAAPQRQTGPGLAEALGQSRAGTLDASAPKSGGLDTLLGNALAR